MAKEITRIAKLQFNAGQAKPGPELAGLGIVMPEFTKQILMMPLEIEEMNRFL